MAKKILSKIKKAKPSKPKKVNPVEVKKEAIVIEQAPVDPRLLCDVCKVGKYVLVNEDRQDGNDYKCDTCHRKLTIM
jgi:transposase-like protein